MLDYFSFSPEALNLTGVFQWFLKFCVEAKGKKKIIFVKYKFSFVILIPEGNMSNVVSSP